MSRRQTDSLISGTYDLTRPTSSFEDDEDDDPAVCARKELLKKQKAAQAMDQARLHGFLRCLVWGGSTPAATTHRKMILVLDDTEFSSSAALFDKSLSVAALKDFVAAQRGRISMLPFMDLQQQEEEPEEVVMRRVEQRLGVSQSVWFVAAAGFTSPRLLRCVALHLLVGRMHPNTRIFLVVSKKFLASQVDNLRVFPSVARHACTTTVVPKRNNAEGLRRKKIFAVGDVSKLGVLAIPDRWSRDLESTAQQRRDEYGNAVLTTDSITTEGVAIIEDVLTSADTVPVVKFAPRFGNGSAFVAGVASSLRFNYVTHTIDFTGSACADDPMAEFGPSLRASRKLTTMIVRRCHLSDRGFIDLAAAVRECPSLTSLDVSENALVSTDGIVALAMALAVGDAPPDEFEAAAAASPPPSATSAASLLSSLPYGYTGAPVCKIKELKLSGCNSICSTRTMWDAEGTRMFFRYLGRCTSLERLDLSSNSFSEDDALAFAAYCVPPPKNYADDVVDASELYQQQQQRFDDDYSLDSPLADKRTGRSTSAANLIKSFEKKPQQVGLQLESLILSNNSICDAGAAIIVNRLAATLRRIELSHCGLSARALIFCGLAVSRHPTLRELLLSYNDLSWEHALRLRASDNAAGKKAILERWLRSDAGLRESLENIPAVVSVSALDDAGGANNNEDEDEEAAAAAAAAGSSPSFLDGDLQAQHELQVRQSEAEQQQQQTSRAILFVEDGKQQQKQKQKRTQPPRPSHTGFSSSSHDESQYCWFMDRFVQAVHSVKSNKKLTAADPSLAEHGVKLLLDLSHCVLATATVRTLLEGGILRGLVSFEGLWLSGNYGVRGETVSLLMGAVTSHRAHSQILRDLALDDVDPEVRERALIGVFLSASSSFESVDSGLEERSEVTGQIIVKKEKEKHRALLETLSCRGPELTDGMLFAIRGCPAEMLAPLRYLDLSKCTLIASGAETIATVAAKLTTLETLIVQGVWDSFFSPDIQRIVSLDESRDHGLPIIRHFADLIMDSKSLRVLDLSENGLGTAAAKCLLGAVEETCLSASVNSSMHSVAGDGSGGLQRLALFKNPAVDWNGLCDSGFAQMLAPGGRVVY